MSNSVRVPFVNLHPQWKEIENDVRQELDILFETSAFVLGPFVSRFEEAASSYLGVRNSIGVNSGTSALHLSMIAAEIGPGDKVLVPDMTFIATAWSILYVGATPILCDVEPETGNIDLIDAERRMCPGVKAIVPVHLYGQAVNIAKIMAFAQNHNLVVIEDAAQSFGAKVDDKFVGGFGKFGCFSFYPGKNLGSAGESGLVVTDDDKAANRIRALRHHAQSAPHEHVELGFNYRMEGIQGLILYHKLFHLDTWTARRKHIAKTYLDSLSHLPLELPHQHSADHVYHLFVVKTKRRDALRQYLSERGIQTGLHYPKPLHRHPPALPIRLSPEFISASRPAGERRHIPANLLRHDG